MSGDVVNLRQARKARDRQLREKQAEENRAKFGQAKGERQARKAHDDLAQRRLDSHRLQSGGPDDPPDGGSNTS